MVEVGKDGPKDGHKTMRIQYFLTNLVIEMVICARKRKCRVFLSLVKEKLKHLWCEQAYYGIKQREYKIC